jgi:hypothetical protein
MLISLLIAIVIIALVYWLITLLPLPSPFKTIILVVFILIAIIYVLQVGGFVSGTLL